MERELKRENIVILKPEMKEAARGNCRGSTMSPKGTPAGIYCHSSKGGVHLVHASILFLI